MTRPTAASERPLSRISDRPPPWLPLADLPTPVERASWLDGKSLSVWVKRDDKTSSVYGGGKVRKLEWLLARPEYERAKSIVTTGAVGSHHLVALALFSAKYNTALHALSFPQQMNGHVRRNLATLVSLGTRFWHAPSRAHLPLAYAACRAELGFRNSVWMGAGGSDAAGCLGFVSAGLELAEQVRQGQMPRPAHVFVAGGTGGTASGIMLGFALAGMRTLVHVVSSVEPWLFNAAVLRIKMAQIMLELRRAGVVKGSSAQTLCAQAGVGFRIDYRELGSGYGESTVQSLGASKLAAAEGLTLEPTYTAKCLASLLLRRKVADFEGPVLFWNTHAATDLRLHEGEDWEQKAAAAGLLPSRAAGADPSGAYPLPNA